MPPPALASADQQRRQLAVGNLSVLSQHLGQSAHAVTQALAGVSDGAAHWSAPLGSLSRSATRCLICSWRSGLERRYMARSSSRSVQAATSSAVGSGSAAGASGSGSTVNVALLPRLT